MACCQLITLQNPHYNEFGYYQFWKQYIEVPCGWCLNCRLDKQNWLSDACEYEQKKYDYICSFVTFTYDDIYIQELSNIKNDDFYIFDGQVAPYNTDKELIYSLKRKDITDFLKRLRRKIDYFYKKNELKTQIDLMRKDFKYICTGEYGDKFGRPHAHFCFFGLDWNFCQKLFEDCWQKGIIESDPVHTGCFDYITKYITKQVHGRIAKQMYDDKGIERPFISHSLGLGKGIILDQFDYIKSHNLCYKTSNDTLRPIPIYYRNFYFHKRIFSDYSNTNNQMIQSCITPDLPKYRWYKSDKQDTVIRYSIKKMNQFRHDQALLRHRELEKHCEDKLIPYEPLLEYYNSSWSDYLEKNQDVKDLLKYGDVVPF